MNETRTRLWIENDVLGLEFGFNDGGLIFSNMIYKPKGISFGFQALDREPSSFWELIFHNERGDRVSIDCFQGGEFNYNIDESKEETTARLRWSNIPITFREDDCRGHVDVVIELRLPTEDPFVYWNPTVTIEATDVTLWNAIFPSFQDINRVDGTSENEFLLTPEGWGTYVENPRNDRRLSALTEQNPYPSWDWPMQFFSYESGELGLYIGHHDPTARTKSLELNIDNESDDLSFRTVHYPDDMGDMQETFTLEYDIAMGVYEGNWYDAAQIYREWAIDAAPWTARGSVSERDNVPDWFTDLCLWWTPGFAEVVPWSEESSIGFEDTTTLLSKLQDRFAVPTGIHWYGWHKNAFDTDHPDHFPPRAGFKEAVDYVQGPDVHVFPYITVRSWDPNSTLWADEGLEAGAAKRASPRYNPRTTIKYVEEYTNPQLLSPMCASTKELKQTTQNVVQTLVEDIGVDGVYLDQMAAGIPPLCFDPNHEHSLGGGSYGVTGYRELLDQLSEANKQREPPSTFTTEANAEPYMDGVGGYLMWHSARADLVPLFSTVYGEYCITFGREFYETDITDDSTVFRSKLAQLFAFGGQLGWFSRPLGRVLLEPEYADSAAYLEEMSTALYASKEYVTAGRRLNELNVVSPVSSSDVEWNMRFKHRGGWTVELPHVLSSVWSSPAKDGIAVAMTNWGMETESGIFTVTADHLSHVDGDRFEARRLTGNESSFDVQFDEHEATLVVTIPAGSTDVIEIAPS